MKWFMKNHPSSVALEIKNTATNSIPFSAVKPHQMKALLAVKSKQGMSYKSPDSSHVRLPFDSFVLKDTEAYVVACFSKQRICLAIDPNKWQGAKPDTPAEFVLVL